MAKLEGQTIANSYDQVLAVNQNGGLSGTASIVEDGSGTNSPMYLSTSKVGIGSEAFSNAKAGAPDALLHVFSSSLPGTSFVKFEVKDADGGISPELDLYRNSASPVNGDSIGGIRFTGNDSVGNVTSYATIYAEIIDQTNTQEDGEIRLSCLVANSNTDILTVKSTGSAGLTTVANGNLAIANGNIVLTTDYKNIEWGDGSVAIDGDDDSHNLRFWTNSAEAARITGTSRDMGIGIDAPTARFHVYDDQSDGDTGYIVRVHNANSAAHTDNADILELDFSAANPDDEDSVFIKCLTNSATKGFWYSDGDIETASGTNIGAISDQRLKENIADYTGGLALIKQMKPRTFTWKSEATGKPPGTQYGFISQELQAITGVVDNMGVYKTRNVHDDESYASITDGKIHKSHIGAFDSIVISAIKELITRVEALESA